MVEAVLVNSGCFLRQLQPITPRLKGPPIFVSKFVLTHVRVFAREGQLRVELWEQPKPAGQTLTLIERLVSIGRRPPQPPKGPSLASWLPLPCSRSCGVSRTEC